MRITDSQLAAVMPRLGKLSREDYLEPLNDAMAEFSIGERNEVTAFLAQLAHESGELRWWRELWGPTPAQNRYEGRRDLGNIRPGDGHRFMGRGPIQITGRSNYHACGQALGVDLEVHPELLERPKAGFRAAGWFWKTRHLNEKSITGTLDAFKAVTRAINGGYNGLADRLKYWSRAKDAIPEGWTGPPPTEKPIAVVVQGITQATLGYYDGLECHVPLRAVCTGLGWPLRVIDGHLAEIADAVGNVLATVKYAPRGIIGYVPASQFRQLGCTVTWDGQGECSIKR